MLDDFWIIILGGIFLNVLVMGVFVLPILGAELIELWIKEITLYFGLIIPNSIYFGIIYSQRKILFRNYNVIDKRMEP